MKRNRQDTEAHLSGKLVIFLLFLTLINLHIMAQENEEAKKRITATWVAWGVSNTIIGFLVL